MEVQGYCRVIEHGIPSATVARNIGAENSDSDLLIFVDDDAFIGEDFVKHYAELFSDPGIDAATGMILVAEEDHGTLDTTRNVESIHDGHTMLRGGNFAIRRSVFFEVGGMDENYIGAANYEDADLAFRLHSANKRVVWSPHPWLFHLSYKSGGGRTVNPNSYENLVYNISYFYLRHYPLLSVRESWSRRRWLIFNQETLFRPWLLGIRMYQFLKGYRKAVIAMNAGPRFKFPT